MIEVTQEEKNRMIQNRLKQYAMQVADLEITLVAYAANGDKESETRTKREIAGIKKAYDAVEKLLTKE